MADQLPAIAEIKIDEHGNQFVIIGDYKVVIIKNQCIGAASCVAVTPEVFRLNQQNIAEFVSGGQTNLQNLLFGTQACPTQAIEVYHLKTGQKLWPKATA